MSELDRLLEANADFASTAPLGRDARPSRRVAVVTCMDTRVDPLAILGLTVGETHVIRNAGGRVTDDVVRSLALSSHALGVDTVVVMEHTRCGVAGSSERELRELTGSDRVFHVIDDHQQAVRDDIEVLAATPELGEIRTVAGWIYDVDTGRIEEVVRWERPD